MNNFNDWIQIVSKTIQADADIIAAIDKDDLDDSAARESFINSVLRPFLPDVYAIGQGRIIDSLGNSSAALDIVIYRRDFPQLNLPGVQDVYLIESVLAVFEVKSRLLRKSLLESLDACASLAKLTASIDKAAYKTMATKHGLTKSSTGNYVHKDPVLSARFQLIGRPPAFIFGYGGIKNSHKQLGESLQIWIDRQHDRQLPCDLKSVPAAIATLGCFAWRNSAPFTFKGDKLIGLGVDDAPVRWIILQLLHNLNRRLKTTPDGFGLKSSITGYLTQFTTPKIDLGVGSLSSTVSKPQSKPAVTQSAPARDHTKTKADVAPTITANKPLDAVPARKVEEPVKKAAAPEPASGSITLGGSYYSAEASSGADDSFPVPEFMPDLTSSEDDSDGDFIETVVHSKPMLNGNAESKPAQTSNIAQAAENAANSEFAETIRQKSPLIEPEVKTINQRSSKPGNGRLDTTDHSEDGGYIETAIIPRPDMSNPEPFPEFQPAEEKKTEAFTSTVPQ